MNDLHNSQNYDDLFDTLVFGIRLPGSIKGNPGLKKNSPENDLVGNLVKTDFLLKYYDLLHQNSDKIYAADDAEWMFIVLRKK